MTKKALEGITVVELATFIAVPAAGRILADMGATVIKIESLDGDNLRYTAPTEGRPLDQYENTTFDLENANKQGIALNTKTESGRKILFQLLEKADIFMTNWRPKARARPGLDYETLKERFPQLVYACVTGYGENGPDQDLPGFDYTAFFARAGILGSLYQKGTVPMNVIPGLGDHQCAMALVSGALAAYIRAKNTGEGEYVSTNLLHTSIYTQAIMIQAAQYPDYGQPYPIDRRTTTSPFVLAYKTKDDRFIQICMPVYDAYYPKFISCIGRPDLAGDERYTRLQEVAKHMRSPEVYDIIWQQIEQKTASEWREILIENDIPFSVAQTWEEVLQDEQAWAIDVFYSMKYANGSEKALVRPPISLRECGLPDYLRAPLLGENTTQILRDLGYSEAEITQLEADNDIAVWRD
ncbi:CaiB/BaiF CoA transferase family protein [Escherichia albertii]|uniref:CaiB/BaiF CoA transferase family protein n=1 Tax=Escherichia albertii TaxID=208962 RepID=UPI0021D4C085|nr:CoA transferase [Escherichia albertii]MCU7290981.1 CoA transferase [Escherichia albertii]QTA17414.1 CoA transferase [Escherichia albertii]HAX3032654.1 CoA transferase [Escherichia albertii]